MARRYAGRLHCGDNVELFAQASADALPSLKALKAIFGRLELFAGVGGRALVSLELPGPRGDRRRSTVAWSSQMTTSPWSGGLD
jgi:hypothetical protein